MYFVVVVVDYFPFFVLFLVVVDSSCFTLLFIEK